MIDSIPCPFCGCKYTIPAKRFGSNTIVCVFCGAVGPTIKGATPEESVRYWNVRSGNAFKSITVKPKKKQFPNEVKKPKIVK